MRILPNPRRTGRVDIVRRAARWPIQKRLHRYSEERSSNSLLGNVCVLVGDYILHSRVGLPLLLGGTFTVPHAAGYVQERAIQGRHQLALLLSTGQPLGLAFVR